VSTGAGPAVGAARNRVPCPADPARDDAALCGRLASTGGLF